MKLTINNNNTDNIVNESTSIITDTNVNTNLDNFDIDDRISMGSNKNKNNNANIHPRIEQLEYQLRNLQRYVKYMHYILNSIQCSILI